jgi:hypothetical protein
MTSRSPHRFAVIAATVGVTGALAAPAALAQTPTSRTVSLEPKGATALKLDRKTAKALAGLGVAVTPINGASVKKGAVNFPITGGSLDPKVVSPAAIRHGGGLQFKAGKTRLRLQNFNIRVNSAGASLSAAAGGARLTTATLDLRNAKITRPSRGGPSIIGTRVSGVRVLLSRQAASALNRTFKVNAFKAGLRLGTATVNAVPRELIIESGSTELTPDAGTLKVLTDARITPGLVAPATSTPAGAFSFPIVADSRIRTQLTSGTIAHLGGISLTRDQTVLSLTDYAINLATGTLAAKPNGGSAADILALDLSNARGTRQGLDLDIAGVVAKINKTASDALTATFGTPSTEGAPLGTVVLKARIY